MGTVRAKGNNAHLSDHVFVERGDLERFCEDIFETFGVRSRDAQIAAAVLVSADARGIPSHGVGRLWRYINGLRDELMLPHASAEYLMDTPSSLVVDAHGALGAPVAVTTMEAVIRKASSRGAAFASVLNSNHFGIAGYYAMMALEEDMIGIAMTNTAALGVPTFARQAMFGTNPIAFAAPANREVAFVLDMSTTAVTRGKVEVFNRLGRALPPGWALDRHGQPAKDAATLLDDMAQRRGGLLPLGGAGEINGGHKGYGLAVMVDILASVLGGGPFLQSVRDTATSSARVSHFFGAIRIDTFRDPKAFRHDMDKMLASLRNCPPAEGAERVYFAGQKEFENERLASIRGIPLLVQVYNQLKEIATLWHVSAPVCTARTDKQGDTPDQGEGG